MEFPPQHRSDLDLSFLVERMVDASEADNSPDAIFSCKIIDSIARMASYHMKRRLKDRHWKGDGFLTEEGQQVVLESLGLELGLAGAMVVLHPDRSESDMDKAKAEVNAIYERWRRVLAA